MMLKAKEKKGRSVKERVRLGALIALLLAAVALLAPRLAAPNAAINEKTAAPAVTPAPARDAREAAYDKDIAALERLARDSTVDEATRAQAGERLARMIDDHQSELGIEEALTQAGFHPCLVLLQNGSLTVMVSERELSGTQSVTILSVCVAHSDIGVENIRIMTGQAL